MSFMIFRAFLSSFPASLMKRKHQGYSFGEALGPRTGILVARNRVKDKLSDLLHDPNNQKYFQDALVTMREDRYVIPIKQEYRLNFPGIVHDQSSSGATLFIEPMAVVNLNNDIKKYILEEKAEVERILRTLTSHVGAEADIILVELLPGWWPKVRTSFRPRLSMPRRLGRGDHDGL